jgi:hypothetical protein
MRNTLWKSTSLYACPPCTCFRLRDEIRASWEAFPVNEGVSKGRFSVIFFCLFEKYSPSQ